MFTPPFPAGRDVAFRGLYVDLKNREVWFKSSMGDLHFYITYDLFFFGLPEVAVHFDAQQIYCESGIIMVETWEQHASSPTAGRVAVKPAGFSGLTGLRGVYG